MRIMDRLKKSSIAPMITSLGDQRESVAVKQSLLSNKSCKMEAREGMPMKSQKERDHQGWKRSILALILGGLLPGSVPSRLPRI